MVTRRYLKDYRLEQKLDEKGRLRMEAVYTGGDYRYADGALATKRARLGLLLAHLGCWAGMLGALLVPAGIFGKTFWVTVPICVCCIPLYYEATAVYAAMREKEPFRHEKSNILSNRLTMTAIAVSALSSAAFVGTVVRSFLPHEGIEGKDVAFMAFTAVFAASSIITAVLSKRFRTEKIPQRTEPGTDPEAGTKAG